MTESKGLSAKQAKAIPRILEGQTCEEGCQAAGISKACFYKWMRDETSRAEFERQQERLAKVAMALLVQNVGKAVSVMVDLLDHSDARLRRLSAKDLIEHYLKHKELVDIETRLDAMEKQLPLG